MIRKVVICLFIATCFLACNYAVAQSTKLVNLIMAGFYPDPNIVKVGPDYYLINSTFAYFPGTPVDWKLQKCKVDAKFLSTREEAGGFIGCVLECARRHWDRSHQTALH